MARKFAGYATRDDLNAAIDAQWDRINQLGEPVGIITATHAYAVQHGVPPFVMARLVEQFNTHQGALNNACSHGSYLLDFENRLQDADRRHAQRTTA